MVAKFKEFFSMGGVLLVTGFFFASILIIRGKWSASVVRQYGLLFYYVCYSADSFCRHHLLFNENIHQRLRKTEYDFFNEISVTDCDRLIEWYADWLAVFTHSLGRWFDLCAFQIAGSMRDLLAFREREGLDQINPLIAEKYVGKWTQSDEQVFKIYYGAKIKRRAFLKVLKIMWRYRYRKMRSKYLDFLLDRYGKHYCEFGIFLVDRVRLGDDIRRLYDGLISYQDVTGSVSKWDQRKMIVQSSVYSLKAIMAKKKSS